MRRATEATAAVLMMVLASSVASAQSAPAPHTGSTPAPAQPKPAANPHSRFWVAGGVGFGAARAGCSECDPDGVSTNGRSLLVDAGFRINPRLDFGVELAWASTKFDDNDEDAVLTSFVMGVVQVRPWNSRGFFFKTGMGAGIVGNGLISPIGVELDPPFTTNTLALMYGAGWVFRREQRFALQVHGTHHVAALGEVTTKDNTSIKNVIGNYWTVMVGMVFR